MRAAGAIGNATFRRRRAGQPSPQNQQSAHRLQQQQQQQRRPSRNGPQHSHDSDVDDEDHHGEHKHTDQPRPAHAFGLPTSFSSASSIDEDEFFDSQETLVRRKCPHLFPKKIRKCCGAVVDDEGFQIFIVVLIAINSIMMGVATYDFIESNPRASRAFEICDLVFLIIFTVELGMQFVYRDFRIFKDGWLCFDFLVVVMSWAFAEVQIVRAFRIFRAFRLLGRVAVLRNLIDALLSVIPNMTAIACLLLLIFYIFAVMFTQLFMFTYAEGVTSEDYFGRLGDTFFSLFQIMTMDNWAEMCREVMAEYTWAWAPFIAFVVVSGFVVVNLIIAVICDAIALLHDEVPNMLEEKHHREDQGEQQVDGGRRSNGVGDDFRVDDYDGRAVDGSAMENGHGGEADGPSPSPRSEQQRNLLSEVDDLSVRLEGLMRDQEQAQLALERLIVQLQLSDAVELAATSM